MHVLGLSWCCYRIHLEQQRGDDMLQDANIIMTQLQSQLVLVLIIAPGFPFCVRSQTSDPLPHVLGRFSAICKPCVRRIEHP